METQSIENTVKLANILNGFLGPDAIELAQKQVDLANDDDDARTAWKVVVQHLMVLADA